MNWHEFSFRKGKIPRTWVSPSPSFPAPGSLWPFCEKRHSYRSLKILRVSPSAVTEWPSALIMRSGWLCPLSCKHLSAPLPLLGPPSFILLSESETRKLSTHPPPHHLWPLFWKRVRKGDSNFLSLISSFFPDIFYLSLIPAFKIIKCHALRDCVF